MERTLPPLAREGEVDLVNSGFQYNWSRRERIWSSRMKNFMVEVSGQKVLDMAHEDWDQLHHNDQVAYAHDYQLTFARQQGLPVERRLSLNGKPLLAVLIPPGRFWMGARDDERDAGKNEKPRHVEFISRPFWLGQYPITQGQWNEITKEQPWLNEEYVKDHPDCAVTCVSWNDIRSEFLSQLGPEFSLPNEAEWEYACRAGTTTRFYWGDDFDYTQIEQYAWYEKNCWLAENRHAQEVGQKLPNGWQLFDMSGNVLEWCDDVSGPYQSSPHLESDSSSETSLRVVRGGYWSFWAGRCRSAYRCACSPDLRDCLLGFRIKIGL